MDPHKSPPGSQPNVIFVPGLGGGGGYYWYSGWTGGGYYGGGFFANGGAGNYGPGYGGTQGGFYGTYGSFYPVGSQYAYGVGGYTANDPGLYGAGGDGSYTVPPPSGGGHVDGGGIVGGVDYVPTHATSRNETVSLLGRDLPVTNMDNGNVGSAVEIQKIETAISILNAHAGDIDATSASDISNVAGIVYTGAGGRSGIDPVTDIFYVSKTDLDGYSAGEFATDIGHDGNHSAQIANGQYSSVQYANGIPLPGASTGIVVANEKQAIIAQQQLGSEIGVTAAIQDHLTAFYGDTSAIIARYTSKPTQR